MQSKPVSGTIFWVFGITKPEIEPWSPGPLVNTLLIRPISELLDITNKLISNFFLNIYRLRVIKVTTGFSKIQTEWLSGLQNSRLLLFCLSK